MKNPHLEALDIELSYGNSAVIEGLRTRFEQGSFVGLIGPNGAGKSTLMLALSGQFRPQRGRILFGDQDIYEKNVEYKSQVGYVHEDPFFYPYLRVEEFLHFVARIKGVPKEHLSAQISAGLEAVCLKGEKGKLAAALSLGMRKKLALAAALLGEPKILFLDEALNGIDVESAFRVKSVLKDLVAKGCTVILSTHVLEVVEKISDRYLIIKEGKIVADLTSEEFKANHRDGQTMDLETYVIQLLAG